MGKLLPILLTVIGLGAGIGGGLVLRPVPEDITEVGPCGDVAKDHGSEPTNDDAHADAKITDSNVDYVKLNNQFVIPVVKDGRVNALVVLALSLEVASGQQEQVYQREPKLRDVFLQVLFDHANAGGFDGAFTSGLNMSLLRDALRESAIKTLGSTISDVLIVDVVRQDA